MHSEWEEKHAEELTAKSKDETERHQKILEEAVADVEELNNQRAARIEAKRKQNKFVQALSNNKHTDASCHIFCLVCTIQTTGKRRSCSERTRRRCSRRAPCGSRQAR